MKMDYYLKLEEPYKEGGSIKCGVNCFIHEFYVVSTQRQRVWVSLNTWREATMPAGCLGSD